MSWNNPQQTYHHLFSTNIPPNLSAAPGQPANLFQLPLATTSTNNVIGNLYYPFSIQQPPAVAYNTALYNANVASLQSLPQPVSNFPNSVATYPYSRYNPYFQNMHRPVLTRPHAYNAYLNAFSTADYSKPLIDYWKTGSKGHIGVVEDGEVIQYFSDGKVMKRKCYCYLLINPDGLSYRLCTFEEFVRAVFYVGKGSRDRVLDHFQQTAKHRDGTAKAGKLMSAKHWTIYDLWRSYHGVICLQIFNRICDNEAFIREASMIEAINVNKLTNKKRGTFYPPSDKWSQEQCQLFGVSCLRRAWKIFKIHFMGMKFNFCITYLFLYILLS